MQVVSVPARTLPVRAPRGCQLQELDRVEQGGAEAGWAVLERLQLTAAEVARLSPVRVVRAPVVARERKRAQAVRLRARSSASS